MDAARANPGGGVSGPPLLGDPQARMAHILVVNRYPKPPPFRNPVSAPGPPTLFRWRNGWHSPFMLVAFSFEAPSILSRQPPVFRVPYALYKPGHKVKPIFHCDAKLLALGLRVGSAPQREKSCWLYQHVGI